MATGRPSKLDTINLEQVKKLYLSGWDDAQVADFFDLDKRTIHNWKKEDPSFFHSLKDWKKQSDERVERSLYERAIGYNIPSEEIFCNKDGLVTRVKTIKHYPPSEVACIFWLKNRQPDKWRDKVPEEADGNLINQTLIFDDIPSNGDGVHRFKEYLHK